MHDGSERRLCSAFIGIFLFAARGHLEILKRQKFGKYSIVPRTAFQVVGPRKARRREAFGCSRLPLWQKTTGTGELSAFTEKQSMYPAERKTPERAWKGILEERHDFAGRRDCLPPICTFGE
jgi:hypothetical protein